MQSNHQQSQPSTGQVGSSRQTNSKNYEEVLTYEQYQTRGRQIKVLIDANPTKDKIVKPRGQLPRDRRMESASLWDEYERKGHNTNHIFNRDTSDERLPFIEMGIPHDLNFVFMQWGTKKPAPGEMGLWAENVNKSFYNADQGIIITASMHAERDGWPMGALERNYASEIIWQSWKDVAGDKSARLRFVVQENITNKGTQKVTEGAYETNPPPKNGAKRCFQCGRK